MGSNNKNMEELLPLKIYPFTLIVILCNNISKMYGYTSPCFSLKQRGWSGAAMVLGKLPVPGRPTNFEQEPTAPIVGAREGCLNIFTLVYHLSFLSPSLRETKLLSQGADKPKPTNSETKYILFSC